MFVLRLFFFKRLILLYIPSSAPEIAAGLATSLGLAWKSGVAAEVLCMPKNSIGRYVYESKLYLETLIYLPGLPRLFCSVFLIENFCAVFFDAVSDKIKLSSDYVYKESALGISDKSEYSDDEKFRPQNRISSKTGIGYTHKKFN